MDQKIWTSEDEKLFKELSKKQEEIVRENRRKELVIALEAILNDVKTADAMRLSMIEMFFRKFSMDLNHPKTFY